MSSGSSFRVLGPLEVDGGAGPVPIPAGKQRVILAVLLLRANRAVPVEHLAERMWGTAMPPDPRAVVQKHVMRLRRTLGGVACIVTEPAGYRLEVAGDQLDLDRFEAQVERAESDRAAGDLAAESARLAEAVRLWRGLPPLTNVPSASMQHAEVAELVELYLRAVERRIDVDLELGGNMGLVADLT